MSRNAMKSRKNNILYSAHSLDCFINNSLHCCLSVFPSMPRVSPVFCFSPFPQVTLPEHTPPGSPVVTVTATDRDSGENGKVTYRLMSSTQEGFLIDPNNGTHSETCTRRLTH